MLTQTLAQYGLAVVFVMRLQNEVLGRWFENWAALVAAGAGGRDKPTRTPDVPSLRQGTSPGPTNGPAGRPVRKLVSASSVPKDAPPSVAAEAGPERLAMIWNAEEALIRLRAYYKWLGEGRPDGQHLRHYFEAAREIRG